jgi:hypothetical protein
MTPAEMEAKEASLGKMKSLLFYQELKQKRIKKIKSKTYASTLLTNFQPSHSRVLLHTLISLLTSLHHRALMYMHSSDSASLRRSARIGRRPRMEWWQGPMRHRRRK